MASNHTKFHSMVAKWYHFYGHIRKLSIMLADSGYVFSNFNIYITNISLLARKYV